MATTTKRQHNALSLKKKIEGGNAGFVLAKTFNVGKATVTGIKNKRELILSFVSKCDSEDGSKKRKGMKKPKNEKNRKKRYFYVSRLSNTLYSESAVNRHIIKMAPPFELDTSPLSEETRKIAEKELRETPENIKEGLEELRKLLKDDPSIYFKDDDETLMVFLRPCKFYAKSAYELMKRVADFKLKYKDILENLVPEDEKEAFTKHNVVNVLTNRDQKGRRVLLVNVGGSWDTSKVSADQLFRIFYLIHEAAILEPETAVRGVVVIMDFDNLTLKQISALTPSFSMKLLSFIQDAMPLRLKEVHMVKQPFIFKMVWAIFKPFIREKLKNRIFFHGSKMSSLHKYLDQSHLPKDYDGELPKIDYTGADWYPVIENYVDHIRTWNTFGRVKK